MTTHFTEALRSVAALSEQQREGSDAKRRATSQANTGS